MLRWKFIFGIALSIPLMAAGIYVAWTHTSEDLTPAGSKARTEGLNNLGQDIELVPTSTIDGGPSGMSQAPLRFTDVSEASGLGDLPSAIGLYGNDDMSSGVAVGDVNRDGLLDVFIPRVGRRDSLYINMGAGTFTDVASEVGLSGPVQRWGSSTGSFIDVEGDGDLDIFVTGARRGSNTLYINNGKGQFHDETKSRGLTWPDNGERATDLQQHGVAVADVNGDGFMDLLVLEWSLVIFNDEAVQDALRLLPESGANSGACAISGALASLGFPKPPDTPPSRSSLWLNDGRGNYVDSTLAMGLDLQGIMAFTGLFADIDNDGWQDLLVVGDGCTTRLFRNILGIRFEDITEKSGIGTDQNGMGAVARDFNGDGNIDLFITAISAPDQGYCQPERGKECLGNRLYLNTGTGSYIDATDELGVRNGYWGWGVAAEDFANRGQIDLVVTNGYSGSPAAPGLQVPAVPEGISEYENDPTVVWSFDGKRYEDVSRSAGINHKAIGHGLVAFDIENDGDLDVLIASSNDRLRLYRNDTPASSAWLRVQLLDPFNRGNRAGDGSRIEVTVENETDMAVGWITTTGSYETQKPAEFHLGFRKVPSEASISIKVRWPGATADQIVEGVSPGRIVSITRDSLR